MARRASYRNHVFAPECLGQSGLFTSPRASRLTEQDIETISMQRDVFSGFAFAELVLAAPIP